MDVDDQEIQRAVIERLSVPKYWGWAGAGMGPPRHRYGHRRWQIAGDRWPEAGRFDGMAAEAASNKWLTPDTESARRSYSAGVAFRGIVLPWSRQARSYPEIRDRSNVRQRLLLPTAETELRSSFLKNCSAPAARGSCRPSCRTGRSRRSRRKGRRVRAFVTKYNGTRNLYYSVNPTRKAMTKKAAKTDIAAIEYLPGDLDPKPDETPEAAKARYLAALDIGPNPTAIIEFRQRHPGAAQAGRADRAARAGDRDERRRQTEKVYLAETEALIDDVESRIKALMETLGSVAGTQNIDRILRLPGTINLPNAKKLREGRTACPTKLIRFNGATCKLEDFPGRQPPRNEPSTHSNSSDNGTNNAGTAQHRHSTGTKVDQHAGWLKSVGDLPANFSPKGKMIVAHSGNLEDLNVDLTQAGLRRQAISHLERCSFALAAIFKADGRFSNEQIAAALMCDLDCNQHITKIRTKRQAARGRAPDDTLARRDPTNRTSAQASRTGASNARTDRRCRQCTTRGWRSPRSASSAATIRSTTRCCSATRTTRHATSSNPFSARYRTTASSALRQLLSDHFGFDLTERHVRDAVKSLALEHCFDPVADMLDEAEADWDGVERLDRMAADYFNCEDTPLNSACVRKTMIAAVARVRQPGCKFDTILVLEARKDGTRARHGRCWPARRISPTRSIIGKDSREVQEQLAAVWIHENAELAGMKKAEVETVKAFASRTGRPRATGLRAFPERQPRHSIEVGTTNSDEYLQSQTGNRRFWPMKVLKAIDLEKLKQDRLQLWGEAAHYQSQGESLTLAEAMWPDAGAEQEKRRVKDPWENELADMPEVVESKRWNEERNDTSSPTTIPVIHIDRRSGACRQRNHPDPRP